MLRLTCWESKRVKLLPVALKVGMRCGIGADLGNRISDGQEYVSGGVKV